jgi:hypothetical protein
MLRIKMSDARGQRPLDVKPDINNITQLGFPEIKLPEQ